MEREGGKLLFYFTALDQNNSKLLLIPLLVASRAILLRNLAEAENNVISKSKLKVNLQIKAYAYD